MYKIHTIPILSTNGSTQYSVGWYSHSVTTPLGGERFGGRGAGGNYNFCRRKYLQDEAVRLNVCLSIGKAWKFINVLAMTVTLKQMITCKGTDP